MLITLRNALQLLPGHFKFKFALLIGVMAMLTAGCDKDDLTKPLPTDVALDIGSAHTLSSRARSVDVSLSSAASSTQSPVSPPIGQAPSSSVTAVASSSFGISSAASSAAPSVGLSKTQDDWLRVDGNQLVNLWGNQVRMTGANWFGFATLGNLNGLEEDRGRPALGEHLQAIAERGLNVLRIPITPELALEWKEGAASYQNFTALIAAAKHYGVKIVVDMQSPPSDSAAANTLWFTDENTKQRFVSAWLWLAEQYKNDDTVLAFDLQNQVLSPADTQTANSSSAGACWGNPNGSDAVCPDALNWAFTAQTLAKAILDIHPNILVIVDGVEVYGQERFWPGGNLLGVRDYPLNLAQYQNRLLYAPSTYGPAQSEQEWFRDAEGAFDFTADGLSARKWQDVFGFIHEEGISHLFFGQWGGATSTLDGDGRFASQQALIENNVAWINALADYIKATESSHTWWAYNPNLDDAGGLVGDDWKTWDLSKLTILEPTLWQERGQPVSLDHRLPLPGGTSVAEVYGINPETDNPVLQ